MSSLEQEIELLRKQLKQTEMEREILKKAVSIFSRMTWPWFINSFSKRRLTFQYGYYVIRCKSAKRGRPSGSYYEYRSGQTFTPSSVDQQLKKDIQEIFLDHRRRYGSRRLQKALLEKGIKIGRHRIRRFMRDEHLSAIQRQRPSVSQFCSTYYWFATWIASLP